MNKIQQTDFLAGILIKEIIETTEINDLTSIELELINRVENQAKISFVSAKTLVTHNGVHTRMYTFKDDCGKLGRLYLKCALVEGKDLERV